MGIPQEQTFFWEYFGEKDIQKNLKAHLGNITGYSEDAIDLTFTQVIDQNFRSLEEQKRQYEEKTLQEREKEFLKQPSVEQAQKLFGARVDKVLLNRESEATLGV